MDMSNIVHSTVQGDTTQHNTHPQGKEKEENQWKLKKFYT